MYRRGHRKKMNISFICAASEDYIKKYEDCLSSQKLYCEKYSYSYTLISDKKYISDWKDYYWKKIYEVRDRLSNTDFIVLIDSDCEIKPISPPIETILDHNSIYYVLGISKRPNSGFMIFKNDQRSAEFLKDVINKREKIIPSQFSMKGENGYVIWSLSENKENTKELDLKWNCSQPDFLDECFIIHYTNKMKSYFKEKI
jgi:hypothetical protein